MEDLEVIVQKMIDAGESEENISLVVKEYNKNQGSEPKEVNPKEVMDSSSALGVDNTLSESEDVVEPENPKSNLHPFFQSQHPDLVAEMKELNATINSRPIMADNSKELERLEEINNVNASFSAPKRSMRSYHNDNLKDIESQIFEQEKKADILSKNSEFSFEEILESNGTYQDLKQQRDKELDYKAPYDQVLEKIKEDTNSDQDDFLGKIGRVFGINAGTSQEADQTINLNSKVEEQILINLEGDNRMLEKIGKGYATLPEKEKLINTAKVQVVKAEKQSILAEAEAARSTITDDTLRNEKFEELDERFNSLLGEVGYDQATQMLKNNFTKTDESKEFDEMVSSDGFFHTTGDAVSTFLEGVVQTGFKGTVGFTADMMSGLGDISKDDNEYSVFDAFSDTVGQLANYNYLPSSQKKNTRLLNDAGDLQLNYKTVSKSLAQVLPFTLAIVNDVKKGKITNIEASLGRLLNPTKSQKVTNSLKLIDSAYRHTLSDNLNMAEELGLDDNQGRIFANTLSMAEGMAELVMPDTRFFKTQAGNAILGTFKKDLKTATTKTAMANVVKNFTKNMALELGEEEIVLATEDLLKFSMVVGHENSEFFDIKRQKELAAATVIMSGALGGANVKNDFQGNIAEIYKEISNDVNGVSDALQAELDSGFHDETVQAEIKNAMEWANNMNKVIKESPQNVTGHQIDLLMKKQELITEMKSVDDAFHPQYKEKIQAINEQINPANAKEKSTTDTTNGSTANAKTTKEENTKPRNVQAEGQKSVNKAKDTQEFFGDVVQGNKDKYKPSKSYEYEQDFNEGQESFRAKYDEKKGNFDEHIATSIPTFRDNQVKKGNAIVETLADQGDALIYDIGGSEGGFVKTITEQSGGKVRSINLDPNPNMKEAFDKTPVQGSEYVQEAFAEGFDDVPAHKPKEKADVVHESMVFQFITPERTKFLDEVSNNYLKDDGLFITEEKFKMDDDSEYKANEDLKNKNHKAKYYTEEQQRLKGEDVLVGMDKNQANFNNYISELESRFDHVGTYWTSGNFRGVVATNNKQKFDKFMKSVGDNSNDYTVAPKSTSEKLASAVRSAKIYKTPSQALSKLQSNPAGLLAVAWDGALETVATAIEAGGKLDSAIRKGIVEIKKSEWYNGLTPDNKKKALGIIEKDLRDNLTPLADAVVPKSKQSTKATTRKSTGQVDQSKKVSTTEAKLLKEKFKNLQKGSKLGAKGIMEAKKDFIKEISSAVKGLVNSKTITNVEANRLLSAVNQLNDKNYDKVKPLVDKVISDIEAKGLNRSIKNIKAKIKKAAKSKRTPQNIRDLAKGSTYISEKHLSNSSKQSYLDALNKVSTALKASSNKSYEMVDQDKISDKLNKLMEESETNRLEDIAQSAGLDGTTLTAKEIEDVLAAENVDEFISNLKDAKAKDARLMLEKQGSYATMALIGLDGTQLSNTEKGYVKELKNADLTLMSSTDIRDMIKIVDNIALNNNFSSAYDIVSKVKAYKNMKEATDIFDKKELGFLRESVVTNFKTVSLMFKTVFKNGKKSAKFNRMSGLLDLSMGYTKARRTVDALGKGYDNLIKKMSKTKNRGIKKSENTMLRGVVSQLIQGSTAEDFSINKSRMEDHLNNLKKSGGESINRYAENLQGVYDKVKDLKSQDEVIQYTKDLNDGNWELVDFWLKYFEANKDALKYNTEVVHGEGFDEVSSNYLPIKMKQDGTPLPKEDGEKSFFNLNGIMGTKPSPTTIKRTKTKKLPQGRILDLDFDAVMFNRANRVEIDINTSAQHKDVVNFFKSPAMYDIFHKEVVDAFISKVNKMRDIQLGIANISNNDALMKTAAKVERTLKTLGTTMALGSITQYPKQYVSVAVNVMARLGTNSGLMFSEMFTNKSNIPLLDMVSVSMRGETQAGTVSASTRITEEEKRATLKMASGIARATGEKMSTVRDLLFTSLRKGDVNVAKASWIAFYKEYLIKNGVNKKDIDMMKEHELADTTLRRDAISYAELQVEETQISSDDSRGSEFYQSSDTWKSLLRGIFLPYQSFNINSKMRMITDLAILQDTNNVNSREEKGDALKSLAGTTAEVVAFQGMKIYVLSQLYALGKVGIKELFDLDVPDEDEEAQAAFKFKKFYSALIKDLNPLSIGAFAEDMSIEVLNFIHYLTEREDSDQDLFEFQKELRENGDGNLFYKYGDKLGFEFNVLNEGGLYQIPARQLEETISDYRATFQGQERDKYGNVQEYDFTDEQLTFMKFSFAVDLISTLGLGEADSRRIINSIKRQQKKEAK